MTTAEQRFEDWFTKTCLSVPADTKDLLRRAWMHAYFEGWDEAERQAE